jgi:hypothetical protein
MNARRNQTALDQVAELARVLNAVGIEPIALKGLAQILACIYPDLGTRYLIDIDLLVPQGQLPVVIAASESLGYQADRDHPVEFAIGHTYPRLTRPYSLEIDLHRTIGLHPCPRFLPVAELIRDSAPYNLNGATLRLPSPTHLVLHHILHSQLHDRYRERINPSFRTLYDFFLLLKHFGTAIDWPFIESRFRQNGEYATLALYLLEVHETFEIEPPVPLRLTPAIRLRRQRRRLFQKRPVYRWFDPSYYWFAGFMPRTRRLREIVAQPGGLRYLLRKFTNPDFYARLRADFGR